MNQISQNIMRSDFVLYRLFLEIYGKDCA